MCCCYVCNCACRYLTVMVIDLIWPDIRVVATCACRYLTGALEEVSQQTGLGEAFLGMIVLPM